MVLSLALLGDAGMFCLISLPSALPDLVAPLVVVVVIPERLAVVAGFLEDLAAVALVEVVALCTPAQTVAVSSSNLLAMM